MSERKGKSLNGDREEEQRKKARLQRESRARRKAWVVALLTQITDAKVVQELLLTEELIKTVITFVKEQGIALRYYKEPDMRELNIITINAIRAFIDKVLAPERKLRKQARIRDERKQQGLQAEGPTQQRSPQSPDDRSSSSESEQAIYYDRHDDAVGSSDDDSHDDMEPLWQFADLTFTSICPNQPSTYELSQEVSQSLLLFLADTPQEEPERRESTAREDSCLLTPSHNLTRPTSYLSQARPESEEAAKIATLVYMFPDIRGGAVCAALRNNNFDMTNTIDDLTAQYATRSQEEAKSQSLRSNSSSSPSTGSSPASTSTSFDWRSDSDFLFHEEIEDGK